MAFLPLTQSADATEQRQRSLLPRQGYGDSNIIHVSYHSARREASLRGGDAGWATTHPVRDGRVDGLSLAPEETADIQACWSAMRG